MGLEEAVDEASSRDLAPRLLPLPMAAAEEEDSKPGCVPRQLGALPRCYCCAASRPKAGLDGLTSRRAGLLCAYVDTPRPWLSPCSRAELTAGWIPSPDTRAGAARHIAAAAVHH